MNLRTKNLCVLPAKCKWNALLNANRQVDKRISKWVFPHPGSFPFILLNDRRNWTCSLAFLILIYPIQERNKRKGEKERVICIIYTVLLSVGGRSVPRSPFMRRGNKRQTCTHTCCTIASKSLEQTTTNEWNGFVSFCLPFSNKQPCTEEWEDYRKSIINFPSFFLLKRRSKGAYFSYRESRLLSLLPPLQVI